MEQCLAMIALAECRGTGGSMANPLTASLLARRLDRMAPVMFERPVRPIDRRTDPSKARCALR